MTPDFGHTFVLVFVTSMFAVGGLLIAIGERFSSRALGTRVWAIYGVQILVTAGILIPVWFGEMSFRLAMLLIAAVTSWELFSVLARLGEGVFRRLGLAISMAYCLLALLPDPAWLAGAPAAAGLALLLSPVLGRPVEGVYRSAGVTFLGTVFPGLCLAFALRLPLLGNLFGDFVFLYCVVEFNDCYAFVCGRYLSIGRKPRSSLSPNKTWVGSIGGLLVGMITGGILAPPLLAMGMFPGLALGMGLAILGQAADLAASAIKRQAAIKDYSSLASVQGGILDLYDSLIFAAPVWFFFLQAVRGAAGP